MADATAYRLITDWPHLDSAVGDEIRAFWSREHANVDGSEATRRLAQVVAHAVDDRGGIAAVATVAIKVLPRLGQPMYYYRCFVGNDWRASKIVRSLLRRSQDVLQDYARQHDYPCIGILLELENQGFTHSLRWARWPVHDFSYIGVSPRGLELRVWYFRGAKLKTRAELMDQRRKAVAAARTAGARARRA